MPTFNRNGNAGRALFQDLIRDRNLVVLYPCNEAAVATTYDRSSANRLNGTNTGISSVTTGDSFGFGFDGATSYISLGVSSALGFERTNSFTVVLLINPNVSALGEILCKWNGTNAGWALGINATRTWRLLLQNTATTNVLEVRSTNAIANNTLKMLCVTYAGGSVPGSIVMYEDGATVAMTTVTNTLAASITNAVESRIGSNSAGGSLLNVNALSMLAVINRAASAEDARRWAFLAGQL